MKYFFFQRPALVFSMAGLTVLTCLEVPIFISLFCLVLWVWKWLADQKIVVVMPRKATTFLSVFLFVYILFEYRTLLAQEASSGLLVGLTALKVMDYENRRDHLLVVLLGFLLLTLKPLYGLDLFWFPIQLICMVSLWWALSQDARKLPRALLGKILAASLPIALLLFLIFPRVVLPWAMSHSKKGAKMGFSSDLNPGEVSRLATSNDLVMRARFPQDLEVDVHQLYWKGAVLTLSDGLAWKTDNSTTRSKRKSISPDEPILRYEIIMEPGQGNLVFSLDPTHSMSSPGNSVIELEGQIWRSNGLTSQAQRYYGESSIRSRDDLAPDKGDLAIKPLPPKAMEWVQQTLSKAKTFQEKRNALQTLFSHPDFVYTLHPGAYGSNPLDEFLFEKRRGFCEHFAGAFGTLARALKIPARIVSGYQGAEYNVLGDFWRITQRQAHAWVELWNGTAWIRQDPTVWVNRVEFQRFSQQGSLNWIAETVDTYEALNYRWTAFLLDFDKEAQSLAIRVWLPKIFLGLILLVVVSFFIYLLKNWFFSSKDRKQQVRNHQLSILVRQIKEAQEQYLNQDLSNVPPLEVLKNAEKSFQHHGNFYSKVGHLYDRTFYQSEIHEQSFKQEMKELEQRWIDIQVLQK